MHPQKPNGKNLSRVYSLYFYFLNQFLKCNGILRIDFSNSEDCNINMQYGGMSKINQRK